MGTSNARGERERWEGLRFAVVGPLLASPPPKGRLRAELERLAQQHWEHPCGEGPVHFSASTIERWYYRARGAHQDPVRALREQYRDHPSWSAQLHHDNLHVRVDADLSVGPMPSYAMLTRMMRSLGLVRQRRRLHYEPERPATDSREVLSYEVSRSHALWHALCGGRRHAAANPELRGQQGIPTRGRNIILDTDSRSMIVLSRSRRHDHVREFVRAAAHN